MKSNIQILVVIFFATTINLNAQRIFERADETHYFYYEPDNHAATKYLIYTRGMWNNNSYNYKANAENKIRKVDYTNFKVKKKGQRKHEVYRTIDEFNTDGRLVRKQKFSSGKEKKNFIY
jgi:hypothetical protein